MSKIFLTSDLHFNHDRAFIWRARGFQSVEEMNEAIVERYNSRVNPGDDVYICGDLCLGGGSQEIMKANMALIERLNGNIHVILGNHDSPARAEMYKCCHNVVEVVYATMIHYNGYHFFLSHYPCMTGNLEKETLKQCTCNIYGHTHQKDAFYEDRPYMFHCGMDAHNCYPVLLDDAIEMMKAKVKECKEQL